MVKNISQYGCGCGKPKGTTRPTSLPKPKK